MIEFLQANVGWILLGVFFLFMLRMHGGGLGMGHDHGMSQHPTDDPRQDAGSERAGSHDHGGDTQPLGRGQPEAGAASQVDARTPAGRGGCCS